MVLDNNSLKCRGGYSCSAASTSATADQRVTRNGSGSFTEVRRRSPGCSQKATALESRPLPRNSCSSRSPTAASLGTDGPSRFRTGAGVSDSQDEDIDDLQDELVLRDAIQHVPDSSAGSEMDGEPDCQVVFAKDGVAIWPSPQTHIPGRLSLTKQYGVMFLSWLPYSKGTLNSDGTFQSVQGESARGDVGHRNQYAIHPMPLREVTMLRKRTPRLGVHYLLLVLRSGLSLPPLYFTYGGIREMLCCLRERSLAVKSVEDPATYLITDAGDPLHRSLVVGYTEEVGVPPAAGDGSSAAEAGSASQMWKGGEEAGHPRGMPWKSLSLWGLEGLARLALDTTASLLMPRHEGAEEPLGFVPGGELRSVERAAPAGEAGASSCREEPRDAAAPPTASGCAAATSPEAAAESAGSQLGGKGEEERVDASAVTGVGVFELLERVAPEMNAAAMRQQARPPPLLLDEWATFFDEEGRIVDVGSLWRRVFQGGVHSDLRREAWKFLVGVYNQDMTSKQRAELMKQQAEQYAVLKQQWQSISPEQERRWSKWRERRIQVDKDVHRTDRCHPENSAFIPNPRRLRNVLLTYSIFNFDLGYCQGMSDLASPLLYVMQSEEEAFWCFVALMDGWMGGNFDSDQRCVQLQLGALGQLLQLLDPPLWACLGSEQHCSEPSLFGSIAAAPLPAPHNNHAARGGGGGGMRHADPLAGAGVSMMLLCCFRWVLVMFKREFEFEDVLRLWEAIWANPHTPYFHLYIALAVLVGRRHVIIEQRLDHAGMLQLCNSMTGSIDLDTTLRDAEVLYHYAGDAGREIINSLPPLHFPGVPSTPAEEGGACGQA